MKYQIQYNICAIVICAIVLFTHLIRKKTKEYHHGVFTLIVIVTMVGAISNVANTVGNMKLVDMNQTVLVVWDYVYFFTLNLPPFLFSVYAVTLVQNNFFKRSLTTKLLIFVPEIITILTLLSNHWTKWYFYYENDIYQRGYCQLILYAADFYFVAFGVIYVFKAKEETARYTKFSVCAFMIIGYVTALVQFMNPPLLLMHFGMAICELALLLFLQKSEEYLNSELGIFNSRIMSRIIKNNLLDRKKMQVELVKIEDLDFIVHNFGDENRKLLLRQIAHFLDKLTKGNVYYNSGGTFAIIVPKEQAYLIEKCNQAIKERFRRQWEIENTHLYINYKMVTFSMPDDVKDLDTFYFCNSEFSNTVPNKEHVVDIADIDFKQIERNNHIEKIIKRAIDEDHFKIYYQPIYSMEKEKITSAEALLRLIDPDDGFISPGEFIPIAEKNGMIIPIGEIVFDKVFRFMKENNLAKLGIEYIEVNLSVVQCMQSELANSVLTIMDRYGIEKKMVNLEITETVATNSPKVLLKNMKILSDNGVTFSMDDFGTGYSNISATAAMPLDIIKLDKSLIDMAYSSQRGKEILMGVVTMVDRMGFKIVAEGIEEKEQFEMLREQGIDYIQGYYFSKPLPEKEFLEYLSK